ncbi:MAG: hypothetical protein R3B70_04325 [Polyangiaceae bacterium]
MTHARRPGIWAVCLLALASSAGCEIIAGLPEVTDGRDAGTTTDTDTAGCGTDTCTAECEPVVLFGASEPTGLALLGGALYHSEKDKVVAHDIESPYSELAAFPTTAPGDVAADESGVYWATSGCVEHATLDQKDPPTTQIGTCDGSPDGQLALDGARVYWIKGKRSTGDCGGGGTAAVVQTRGVS